MINKKVVYYLFLFIMTAISFSLLPSYTVKDIYGLLYLIALMIITSLFSVYINDMEITFTNPIVLAGFLLFGVQEALILTFVSVFIVLEKDKKTQKFKLDILNRKLNDLPGMFTDLMILFITVTFSMKSFMILSPIKLYEMTSHYSNFGLLLNTLPTYVIPLLGYLLTFTLINGTLVVLYLKFVKNIEDIALIAKDMIKSTPTLMLVDLMSLLLAIAYLTTNWVFTTLIIAPLSIAGIAIQLYYNLIESHIKTSKALAESLEAKDKYTSGHSTRVQIYSELIAKKLNISKKYLKRLEFASLMHDIGKIGVNDAVLNKSGKLDDFEFNQIKTHPEIGSKIISNFDNIIFDSSKVIKYHHSYYDGSGYPKPPTDEKIPFLSRILSVADTLDAMTSDRPYRKALPLDIAVQEIKVNSGKQFHPDVVEAFIQLCEEGIVNQYFINEINLKTNIYNEPTNDSVQKIMVAI